MSNRVPVIELIVSDVAYRDIKRCSVTRAFDQLADEVAVDMTDLWATLRPALRFPFDEGEPFELRIDGEAWVQGIITERNTEWSKDSHSVTVNGMSWAVNLTTSCHLRPRKWYDAKLDRIVRDVVKPYGLDVHVQAGVDLGEPFKTFGCGVGETSFEIIRRAATKRGLYIISDINADIVIATAGRDRMSHVLVGAGVPGRRPNMLSAGSSATFLERHDEIIVVGQSGERADWLGDQATHGFASAHDFGVNIFRPLVIHEPSESGATKLQRRADHEVRVRAGRARRYRCVVQGYLAEEERRGPVVWLPNKRIQVLDVYNDVQDELFIERVTTEFDADVGTTTSLELVAPQTYDLLAPPPKKREQPRGRKGWFVAWP